MQLALVGLDGIEQVRVFLGSSTLQITHDPEKIAVDDIAAAVRHAPAAGQSGGYDAVLLGGEPGGPPVPTP